MLHDLVLERDRPGLVDVLARGGAGQRHPLAGRIEVAGGNGRRLVERVDEVLHVLLVLEHQHVVGVECGALGRFFGLPTLPNG